MTNSAPAFSISWTTDTKLVSVMDTSRCTITFIPRALRSLTKRVEPIVGIEDPQLASADPALGRVAVLDVGADPVHRRLRQPGDRSADGGDLAEGDLLGRDAHVGGTLGHANRTGGPRRLLALGGAPRPCLAGSGGPAAGRRRAPGAGGASGERAEPSSPSGDPHVPLD